MDWRLSQAGVFFQSYREANMFSTNSFGEERYEVSVKRIVAAKPASDIVSESSDDPAEVGNEPNRITHAEDYSSVRWLGELHHFTPLQRRAIKVLWDAMETGLPDVHQRVILIKAGSRETRLKRMFDKNKAWGRMIFPSRDFGGKPGYYRLAPPPEKRGRLEAAS
jgi:hypothetical protein